MHDSDGAGDDNQISVMVIQYSITNDDENVTFAEDDDKGVWWWW